ncbi:MAG: ATP-binding protein [Candidatus Sericytochromatia bacterium]|nr:ATP-binding protein [Candidatus Tanganyikabacteria bacterium]
MPGPLPGTTSIAGKTVLRISSKRFRKGRQNGTLRTVSAADLQPQEYIRRVVDGELDDLLPSLAAVAIEGAKAVGKTATAAERARTVYRLDQDEQRLLIKADSSRLLQGEPPILVDEWQRMPSSWDVVRRAVDDRRTPAGSFILTGSASAAPEANLHSGAGRIVTVRMRPMTLLERGVARPTVSLAGLLQGAGLEIAGRTAVRLADYVDEILASGFPGLRGLTGRPLRAQLDGYLDRIVEREFPQLGVNIRNPAALRRWLAAYAAASSTTTSFEKIRDAASAGQDEKPAKKTVGAYRDALERLWVLDPLPAWAPTRSHLRRLSYPPKHQLVDPALAARLLGVGAGALLQQERVPVQPPIQRGGMLLGGLFESLVTIDVRVYAQAAEARVGHLRTASGDREIDLIVERDDGRIVAIEVKLSAVPDDHDVRHLHWLKDRLGDGLLDMVVIGTGAYAYRREDGVAVVPAALLGP